MEEPDPEPRKDFIMIKDTMIALALTSAIAFAPTSYAIAKETANSNPSMETAARDFTKLSHDGFSAFRNIHLARLALFDGKPDQAKTFVSHAQSSLKKAESDETAFTKSLADIQPPKGAKNGKSKIAGASANQPIKWLPIDADMTLTEEYDVTPKNNEAVTKANKQLKKGDRKAAIETLKLAGIDTEYTTVLMPLEHTKAALETTVKDIDSDGYYQANLVLKDIEDSMVIDVVDVLGEPEAAKSAKTEQGSDSSMATTQAGQTKSN